MNNSKISIIVPVYNTEEYLDKCIKSIINQTYRNLEIILVNDGSTDKSLDICKKYFNIDGRVVVINKVNGGVSSARNSGLEIITGDYIGFVDSDDSIEPRMYEALLFALELNNADISECGHYYVDTQYNVIGEYPLENSIVEGNYECSRLYLTAINTRDFNCNKLYKKSIFENIRYPSYKYSEDFWVNTRALYKCSRKVTISGCYYYYMKNQNSACNRSFNKDKLDIINSGKDVYEFYKYQFQELCPFVALYIASNTVNLFKNLQKSDCKEKRRYRKQLITELKTYYPLIYGDAYKNIKFTKLHLAFLLFKIKPELYMLFYNFNQKIKGCTI